MQKLLNSLYCSNFDCYFSHLYQQGRSDGGGVYIGIYTPQISLPNFFMWLFCLLDPGQITFIPTQIRFLATTLFTRFGAWIDTGNIGGMFNSYFISNCPQNVTVKEFWKSVNIWCRFAVLKTVFANVNSILPNVVGGLHSLFSHCLSFTKHCTCSPCG